MNRYDYKLYGFHVCSEIKLEEVLTEDKNEKTDIYILQQEMPAEYQRFVKMNAGRKNIIAAKTDGMGFRIEGVADYLVEKGDTIIVSPLGDTIGQPAKTYLLGSAFGYYFALNNIVAIHGGAVAWNDTGLIVTGDSGAGKSTITTGLLAQNFQFIADDVCVLSYGESEIKVNFAYPQQKLCRDAVIRAGYDVENLIYIDEDRDKFAKRLNEGYLQNGAGLKYMFELQISMEAKEVKYIEVQGQDKLMTMIRNVFRGESAFKLWGMPAAYMKKCIRLASEVTLYRIIRPAVGDTTDEILEYIMNVAKREG